MKLTKRNNYNLKASVHTAEVKSEDVSLIDGQKDYIKTVISKDGRQSTSVINPNKYRSDIFSFERFKEVFEMILQESQIDDYRFTRADMRLDNYDPTHYRAFSKLNKYLISAMMVTYKVKNKYKTLDLLTEDQISIAIKNDYFEVENYDRSHKNMVTGNTREIAQARLEERTKAKTWRKLNDDKVIYADSEWNMEMLKHEFTVGWSERWDKARKNLKQVQDTYNEELVKKYYDGLNARPVQFRTLTDFLIQKQDCIFTSMQMVDLLKRLGVTNAENRAKYHKKRYGIEYFSQKDVDYAIREIKRATAQFFDC